MEKRKLKKFYFITFLIKTIRALYLSLSLTHTLQREREKEKTPRALFVFFVIKILLILLRLLHAFFYTDSLERRRRR